MGLREEVLSGSRQQWRRHRQHRQQQQALEQLLPLRQLLQAAGHGRTLLQQQATAELHHAEPAAGQAAPGGPQAAAAAGAVSAGGAGVAAPKQLQQQRLEHGSAPPELPLAGAAGSALQLHHYCEFRLEMHASVLPLPQGKQQENIPSLAAAGGRSSSSKDSGTAVEGELEGFGGFDDGFGDADGASRGAEVPAASDVPSHTMAGMASDLLLSGALTSPNCNVTLRLNASRVDLPRYFARQNHLALFMALMATGQVHALAVQMGSVQGAPALARLSLPTLGAQALMDAYLCLLQLTTAMVIEPAFATFALAALCQFVLFAVLGMRYMLAVWRAQRPNIDTWSSASHELSAMYTLFYAVLMAGLVCVWLLQRYAGLLLMVAFSYWLPQIARSVRTDTRPALLEGYLLQTAIARLALPIYVYGCPSNVMDADVRPGLCAALLTWQAVQVVVLLGQMRFGPRWFVPKALLPKKYDYHRHALPRGGASGASSRAGGAGSGTSAAISSSSSSRRSASQAQQQRQHRIGRASGTGSSTAGGGSSSSGDSSPRSDEDVETGHGSTECVICMCPVPLQPLSDRMVTPCDHFFHTHCLLRWMEVKMECPTCRRLLPPL